MGGRGGEGGRWKRDAKEKEERGLFFFSPGGLFTTAVHRWVQTQVCSPTANGGKRGRGKQDISEKNAIHSPYCLWGDYAHNPTQLAHKAKKLKYTDTEMGMNQVSKKFQPNSDVNYYLAIL